MARLPILMYHQVSQSISAGLTISAEKLKDQFRYLSERGYQSHHLKDLEGLRKLPRGKHVVITFDDGYVGQLEHAYPLLKQFGLKATFFIPLKFVGKSDEWNSPSSPIMTSEQLKSLDSEIVELAYHSYAHKRFDEMSPHEVKEDTVIARDAVKAHDLSFSAAIAYPYGKFPKRLAQKQAFKNTLRTEGLSLGLRIGNRVNRFPFRSPYEVQRLDVKGQYSLWRFRRKLKHGKVV